MTPKKQSGTFWQLQSKVNVGGDVDLGGEKLTRRKSAGSRKDDALRDFAGGANVRSS
jgi:hypothetical protein